MYFKQEGVFALKRSKQGKYLADLLNALQSHVCQHVRFNAAKEDVIIHLIHHLFILLTRSDT